MPRTAALRRELSAELTNQGVPPDSPIRAVIVDVNASHVIVARDATGRITGGIGADVEGKGPNQSVDIIQMRVLQQRQGVGQALIADLAKEVGDNGELKVYGAIDSAKPFYAKTGASFQPDSSLGVWSPESIAAMKRGETPPPGEVVDRAEYNRRTYQDLYRQYPDYAREQAKTNPDIAAAIAELDGTPNAGPTTFAGAWHASTDADRLRREGFTRNSGGGGTNGAFFGQGTYFHTDPEDAKQSLAGYRDFIDPSMEHVQADVTLQHPFVVLAGKGDQEPKRVMSRAMVARGLARPDEQLTPDQITQRLESAGYDGVQVKQDGFNHDIGGNQVVAFHNDQIATTPLAPAAPGPPEPADSQVWKQPNTNLSEQDKQDMLDYAWDFHSYADINHSLRNGVPLTSPQTAALADRMHALIERSRLPANARLYRNTFDSTDLVAQLRAAHQGNGIWTEHGFMSTSLDPDVAASFDMGEPDDSVHFEISVDAPKGAKALVFDGALEGREETNQQEVLLQRGSRFRVDSLTKGDDAWHAKVTLLTDDTPLETDQSGVRVVSDPAELARLRGQFNGNNDPDEYARRAIDAPSQFGSNKTDVLVHHDASGNPTGALSLVHHDDEEGAPPYSLIDYAGARGKGAGTALARAAEQHAREHGRSLYAEPTEASAPFWRKMGFTEDPDEIGGYFHGKSHDQLEREHLTSGQTPGLNAPMTSSDITPTNSSAVALALKHRGITTSHDRKREGVRVSSGPFGRVRVGVDFNNPDGRAAQQHGDDIEQALTDARFRFTRLSPTSFSIEGREGKPNPTASEPVAPAAPAEPAPAPGKGWTVVSRHNRFGQFQKTGFRGTWQQASEHARNDLSHPPLGVEYPQHWVVPETDTHVEMENGRRVQIAPTAEERAAARAEQRHIQSVVDGYLRDDFGRRWAVQDAEGVLGKPGLTPEQAARELAKAGWDRRTSARRHS